MSISAFRSTAAGSGLLARLAPLRRRLRSQAGSAGLLLAATVVALVWVNAPFGGTYNSFWHAEVGVRVSGAELALDLRQWVNDGLMTFFFYVVGLEVKRELVIGDLADRRRAATPALAALTGLAIPALVYVAINMGTGSSSAWGVVISTDTAFLLGVLALLGRAGPPQLRVFLLALAIADDIGALTVIALFYTENLRIGWLALAALGLALMFGLRWLRIWRGPAYLVLAVASWVALYASGVEPTLLGVAIALSTQAYRPRRDEVAAAARRTRAYLQSPNPEYARTALLAINRSVPPGERMQQLWQPWTNFVIVPLFALANAGVPLTGETLRAAATSPVTIGVVAGLVLGKPVGILLGTGLAVRLRLGVLAPGLTRPALVGGGALSGIGFTISLFIVDLAFTDPRLADQARVGILAASVLAAVLGSALLWLASRRRPQVADQPAQLDPPVDAERDHIRGPVEAPLTLVEYGDFECPFCAQATGAIDELRGRFGDRLRYVFRNVPLLDVHPHAELAAEAAEAAAAQGRYWQMYDQLFAAQDRLTTTDLLDHADTLGLDVQQFADDLGGGQLARRIEEDVGSGDASGVTGTPTFFVNGRRHSGPYDARTLAGELLSTEPEATDTEPGDAPTGTRPAAWLPARTGKRLNAEDMLSRIPADLPETPDRAGILPRMTEDQTAALERFGHRQTVSRGDVLFRAGDRGYDLYVVLSGAVAIVEYAADPRQPEISVHEQGRFLGEIDFFTGQSSSRTAIVVRPGEVLRVPADQQRAAFRADAELRELVQRTFLLRRARLLEAAADLRIITRPGSTGTLRLQDYADAHQLSTDVIDAEPGGDDDQFLTELDITETDLPVVILRTGRVLRNPTDAELDQALQTPGP